MNSEHESAALGSTKGYESSEYLGLYPSRTEGDFSRKGISLTPLRRLIQRNGLLIGIPTIVAAVVTAGMLAFVPSKYSGSFQVQVEPLVNEGKPSQPAVISADPTRAPAELDYETLMIKLKSQDFLAGFINKIKAQYPAVTYANLAQNLVVERLQKNNGEKTKILNVTYESLDPQEILAVLNELASGYVRFGRNIKSQVGGGVVYIEQQLPQLKQQVEKLEQQLQILQQQNKISDLNSEGTELAQQSRQIQTQQLEAQRDLVAQKNLYNTVQSQLGMTPKEVVKASSLSENPRYQALLNQLKQVETQIALVSDELKPEHPEFQKLQGQRKYLASLISQESQKLVGSSAVPQFQNSIQKNMSQQLIDSLNQIQLLEVRVAGLQQANAAVDQQIRQFPEIKRRYSALQSQLEIDRSKLSQLQLKRQNFQIDAAQQEFPWRLMAKPDLLRDSQGRPVTSSRLGWQKILLGMLGGFLLGLGAAILREKRQDIFYTIEDLQQDLPRPLMGAFPLDERLRRKSPVPKVETDPSPDQYTTLEGNPEQTKILQENISVALDQAAENLYANLRFLPIEANLRSLIITSASSKDGKTMVVTYLARALASMGQRVLVVDANMVLPQLHTWLDVPNFAGLNEVLTQEVDPNELIQRSPLQSNLFVLSAGQVSPTSRKLMASQQMQHLMGQLRDMFDVVLYDTPALQNYPDANFLSLHADGTLMVVSIAKTHRSLVLKLLKRIQGARIPLLGVVANRAKPANVQKALGLGSAFSSERDEFELFRVSEH